MRNPALGERGPSAAKEAVILLGTDTPIGLAVIRDLGHHGYFTIGIGRKMAGYAIRDRSTRPSPSQGGDRFRINRALGLGSRGSKTGEETCRDAGS